MCMFGVGLQKQKWIYALDETAGRTVLKYSVRPGETRQEWDLKLNFSIT